MACRCAWVTSVTPIQKDRTETRWTGASPGPTVEPMSKLPPGISTSRMPMLLRTSFGRD